MVPVTFAFNADADTIDVGGIDFGATKKWRDAQANPRVTFLLDDVLRDPRRARAIEVRGRAEALATGGSRINPRFPNFAEEFLRIHPDPHRQLGPGRRRRHHRRRLPRQLPRRRLDPPGLEGQAERPPQAAGPGRGELDGAGCRECARPSRR